MNHSDREAIDQMLRTIHDRVQWIADVEARSAWVNGIAANGALLPEKIRLLEQAERILDRLQAATD